MRAESSFQVLGIYVETSGRDDHIFLAAAETQIALGIEFAKIACAQPAFLFGGPNGSLLPITAGNIFAADEDFAVFGELEFAARQDSADRSFRGAKGMIQADQRGCFRHPVTLNNGIAHAFEKVLGFI